MEFESNEKFIEFVRNLGDEFVKQGIISDGRKLLEIVNEMAYVSSSEMLGDIQLVLREAIKNNSSLMSERLLVDSSGVVHLISNAFRSVT